MTQPSFERACSLTLRAVAVLALLTIGLPYIAGGERLTATLAFTQDLPLVPVLALILLFAPRWTKTGAASFRPPDLRWWIAGSILLILLVGWAGHYAVLGGYDLSRDEQMASFDAAIFRGWHLFEPIPAAWRRFADALNLTFILPIGAREYWASAYLPGNAAWRAVVSLVDPALASPLMTALGAYCTWRVSRLLWPVSAAAQLVCLLLIVGSSQILLTAMTAYSMSMHFGLNMMWLWLFLLNRRSTHAAAMAVGWLAMGIHQPLFHALFVLPFLLMLAGEKRWKLLAAYLIAYALIGTFWIAWPLWISAHGTVPAVAISGTAGVGFFDRLRSVLHSTTVDPPWMVAANLLRFICWQHPLLMPLGLIGAWSGFRRDPLCRALAIGFVLPLLAMALLLPWQGYGWGYRYLHPVLGNAVLLGGYGWRALEAREVDLRSAMLRTSAIAMLILLPVHALMANRLAAPWARLHHEMASNDADILIIDTEAAPYADDLVINRADLANRPKLLIARFLKPADLGALCRLGSVGFVPGPRLAPVAKSFGAAPATRPTSALAKLAAEAPRAGCTVKSF